MNRMLEKIVSDACKIGLEKRIFSGVSVGVLFKKRGQWNKYFYAAGKTGFGNNYAEVTTNTFFDLASLTKPLCTVPCVLNLVKRNKIDLSSKLNRLLMIENGPGKENIEIRHLLYHSAGFEAYRPFYTSYQPYFDTENKKEIFKTICKQPLLYETGKNNCYSDIGFILLGSVIEYVANQRLDIFFKNNISDPLGVGESLCFLAHDDRQIKKSEVAATEQCGWRKRIIHGEVHDEHCFLMGGVAAHAGLFGNISGVAGLCQAFFDQWLGYEKHEALAGDLFQKLFTKENNSSTWYMGFDTPSKENSSSGQYFSPESAGHLGFTGTSFWMDPVHNIIIVLLTNRVHPTRENKTIRKFRPFFHDAVMQTLIESKM